LGLCLTNEHFAMLDQPIARRALFDWVSVRSSQRRCLFTWMAVVRGAQWKSGQGLFKRGLLLTRSTN
jgi:hypothetical protein